MSTRHEISVDGETVVAVHHSADSDDWLVFCHGFLSDKTGSYEGRCERAVREGYDAVRFDFRGCGESSRQFGEQTLSTRLADLRSVLQYFDPPRAVLFGSSFGGKVAFHAAATTDRIDAIVTRAPVTDNGALEKYRGTDADTMPEETATAGIDGEFFEDLDRYQFAEAASAIEVPVAIFHGRDDESVPVVDTLSAAGSIPTDVMVRLYAGEGHRFSRDAEASMRDATFDWLETH